MSSFWQVNQNVVDGVMLLVFLIEMFLFMVNPMISVVFQSLVLLDVQKDKLVVELVILQVQIVTVLGIQLAQLMILSLNFWKQNLFFTLAISKHGKSQQKMEQA